MAAATPDTVKQAFLDALALSGVHSEAARVAGVHAATARGWRSDPQFDDAYVAAMAEAADALELEARRRAVDGVAQAKFYPKGHELAGQEYTEYAYSDQLLTFLLKGRKREVFGDKSQLELSNPDGSMKPENPTDAAARLAAMFDEARRRRDAEEDELFQ